jgi:hypothetical protein
MEKVGNYVWQRKLTRITINIDETPFSVHKSTIGTKIVIEHGFSSVGYNTSKSFVC